MRACACGHENSDRARFCEDCALRCPAHLPRARSGRRSPRSKRRRRSRPGSRPATRDTSYIVFGSDWQEAFIGENLGLTIELSSEASYWDGASCISAFQNRQTLFRALRNVDFALRRPELFVITTGVRP